jgi:hypothetical protein
MLVFPPIKRGVPIGARFIRELMAVTPPESLQGCVDKEANYGAPVPVIAVVCTLVCI